MEEFSVGAFFHDVRPELERALVGYLPLNAGVYGATFNDAVRSAVGSQGKRLRPLLTLAAARALGGEIADALPTAVAIEYVHTSSLILDDLPTMDNSLTRRGRPALHVQYGEAVSVLAAIALLNRAYELVLETGTAEAVKVHHQLTQSIGAAGMIRGQVADLAVLGTSPPPSASVAPCLFEVMLKTTSLFKLCLIAGALCARAPESTLDILERYGEALGTAFQLHDDLEDNSPMSPASGTADRLAEALHHITEIAAESDSPDVRNLLEQLNGVFQQFVAAIIAREQFAHILPRSA
jgi:geranylgeranyl diphosphate synthase type II